MEVFLCLVKNQVPMKSIVKFVKPSSVMNSEKNVIVSDLPGGFSLLGGNRVPVHWGALC